MRINEPYLLEIESISLSILYKFEFYTKLHALIFLNAPNSNQTKHELLKLPLNNRYHIPLNRVRCFHLFMQIRYF